MAAAPSLRGYSMAIRLRALIPAALVAATAGALVLPGLAQAAGPATGDRQPTAEATAPDEGVAETDGLEPADRGAENSPGDYGSDLGEIFGCVWAVGPVDCNRAKGAADDANNTVGELANNGTFSIDSLHNGKGDGFRHCYWNALMVHRIGADQAKEVADAHEDKDGQPAAEKDMDLHNNGVGRDIARSTNGDDNAAKQRCIDAANNGTLKTLK